MAKKHEYTSPRVAKLAAKKLRDPKSSKAMKTLAGSNLTQARDKPKAKQMTRRSPKR